MFAAPVPPSTPLDQDATNTPPPASGPFMITAVDAPRTLTMERNPQFQTVKDAGADEVADAGVDKITVTQNKNNSAQVTDVEQNKVDFMLDPPDADRLGEVKAQFGDRFRLEESINTYYFWMNTQTPPFNDLRVRQAINYAIDPEALNRVFGGRLHPTQQILPPGMPGYQEYELYPGPDMEKAKQLLAEANPADKDITVWTDDEPDRKRIGEYYQDLLTQLGFNATAQGDRGRRLLHDDRQRVDAGPGHRFRRTGSRTSRTRTISSVRCCTARASCRPTATTSPGSTSRPTTPRRTSCCQKQLGDGGVEEQYAALDKAYMEQAVWAPYGNEQFATFVSERMDFDKVYHHLLFNQDYSAFALK